MKPKTLKIVDIKNLNRIDPEGNDNPNGLLVDYAEIEACSDLDCAGCREKAKQAFAEWAGHAIPPPIVNEIINNMGVKNGEV